MRQCEGDGEFLASVGALAIAGPFLAVIRSEETGGEVTGAALAALKTLLRCGLLDPGRPQAQVSR